MLLHFKILFYFPQAKAAAQNAQATAATAAQVAQSVQAAQVQKIKMQIILKVG